MACIESAGECEFGFDNSNDTCGAVCEAAGGECVTAFNDDNGCDHGVEVGCGYDGLATAICVCTRGCGTEPPCPPSMTCNSGSCR
jgi:hypothetical protein